MARRMARYWPGAKTLSGEERVTVVRAVRRGEHVADPLLSQPVIEYSRGLHDAAETGRRWRWVLAFVLAVAAATAIWDAVYGSWGNAVASGIYLVLLLPELFWWPKWLERLAGQRRPGCGDGAAFLRSCEVRSVASFPKSNRHLR